MIQVLLGHMLFLITFYDFCLVTIIKSTTDNIEQISYTLFKIKLPTDLKKYYFIVKILLRL